MSSHAEADLLWAQAHVLPEGILRLESKGRASTKHNVSENSPAHGMFVSTLRVVNEKSVEQERDEEAGAGMRGTLPFELHVDAQPNSSTRVRKEKNLLN